MVACFCLSSGAWRTIWGCGDFILSFMGQMKDIWALWCLWFVLHWVNEGHFRVMVSLFCPSLGRWKTFGVCNVFDLSFIGWMKDILGLWRVCFVLHGADERHLGSEMVSVLSFIKWMKDILKRGWLAIVFHVQDEGHFKAVAIIFCLSSDEWRTFWGWGDCVLSFIKRMKDIFKTWLQKDTWAATKLSF